MGADSQDPVQGWEYTNYEPGYRMGREGWELVATWSKSDGLTFIFRRPLRQHLPR
jgi:hypothetical protein